MAEGIYKQPVVITNGTNTEEIQAGVGGYVDISISVPQGMTPIMATVRESTGGNLFPVWLNYIDPNNTYVRVRYANLRTSAYTGAIQVYVLCM